MNIGAFEKREQRQMWRLREKVLQGRVGTVKQSRNITDIQRIRKKRNLRRDTYNKLLGFQ